MHSVGSTKPRRDTIASTLQKTPARRGAFRTTKSLSWPTEISSRLPHFRVRHMAEIAGLLLGGIPIAIWALEKYSAPWETYHDYGRAMGSLLAQLTIQQKMLQKTFENIGLETPSKDELRERFHREYPDIAEELLVIVNEMEILIAGLLENLRVDVNKKVATSLSRSLFRPGRSSFGLIADDIPAVVDKGGP